MQSPAALPQPPTGPAPPLTPLSDTQTLPLWPAPPPPTPTRTYPAQSSCLPPGKQAPSQPWPPPHSLRPHESKVTLASCTSKGPGQRLTSVH